MADENENVTQSGYPGELRNFADSGSKNLILFRQGSAIILHGTATLYVRADVCHKPSGRSADPGSYESDFYQGMPVLSVNQTGKGQVPTISEQDRRTAFYHAFMKQLCTEQEILHDTDARNCRKDWKCPSVKKMESSISFS
jgi:beta-galactosidase